MHLLKNGAQVAFSKTCHAGFWEHDPTLRRYLVYLILGEKHHKSNYVKWAKWYDKNNFVL
jgi:hypothetical protein